jgi:hypothetical protein
MTGVQRYKESLVLKVLAVDSELTMDQRVMARMRLENRGLSALAFCIDDTAGSLITHNITPPCGMGINASHHSCEHRLILDPGDHYDWQKWFIPPTCPEPKLCVTASVVIANPMNCQYGSCESVELESTDPLCTEIPSKQFGSHTPGRSSSPGLSLDSSTSSYRCDTSSTDYSAF